MFITLDIGNTHIVTAIVTQTGDIKFTFRISTANLVTEDEYFSYLKSNLDYHNIALTEIKDILVSSVVPRVTTIFDYFGKKYFNIVPLKVSTELNLPFSFANNVNYAGFGADRIVNICQSIKEYPNQNLIIFDLGTATTYEIIKNNQYIGGGIFPGIEMSLNALFTNTAKLPKVNFTKPKTVLGYDISSAIQGAIYYGYLGQVKEIIKQIKQETKEDFLVIMTGGLGKLISSDIEEVNIYDSELGIKGLYSLYLQNKDNVR